MANSTGVYSLLQSESSKTHAPSESLELDEVPTYLSSERPQSENDYSSSTHSNTPDGDNISEHIPFSEQRRDTIPGQGLWKDQMLVDRTLRSMAALLVALATTMVVSCISLSTRLDEFGPMTTSISIAAGSKQDMDRICQVLKFIINVAATLVLSSSNTYQQLATSLDTRDLRHALANYGDSRVATNSPFAIRHKRKGRWRAFLAWGLLILTSTPLHLLANSVVGVARIYSYDIDVSGQHPYLVNDTISSDMMGRCWAVLRLGHFALNPSSRRYAPNLESDYEYRPNCTTIKANETRYPNPWSPGWDNQTTCFSSVELFYDEGACGKYLHQSSNPADAASEWEKAINSDSDSNCTAEQSLDNTTFCHSWYNLQEGCTTDDFACQWTAIDITTCNRHGYHLVARFSASLILAICLTIKAVYMISVNFRARTRTKTQCLTFGDVLVASVFEDIHIHGESLINGGDFYRRKTSHTCHEHCKEWAEASETGDDLGHCQKCSKFNSTNNMTNLPWPALAMKRKKSLITNLGQTALTQMLILSLCSTACLVASIILTVYLIPFYSVAVCAGWTKYYEQFTTSQSLDIRWKDTLWGEIEAFCISNGAQLIYSALFLLLLYNLTLISIEHEWGQFERGRQRLRCTIVKGPAFEQSYLLQLPKRIMFPIIGYSIVMHWLLGLSIYTEETISTDTYYHYPVYSIVTVPACVWGSTAMLLLMTIGCWWAYTYRREGYIPQMFGSIRTLCAATSELDTFPAEGIHWGDLTTGKEEHGWRHAGLSSTSVKKVVPNELYA